MKTRITALITAAALTTALLGAGATAAIAAGSSQDTITVDAGQDPTAAAADLKLITNATDASFTPSANPLTVDHSAWSTVEAGYINPIGGKTETPSWTDQVSSAFGWSLGGQVSASVGTSLLGLVGEKLTVTFGVNHTWQTTNTHAEKISATVPGGQKVYLVKRTNVDDITGDYSFTAGGTHFNIDNVTINVPPSSGADQVDDTTYELKEIPLTGKTATDSTAMTQFNPDKDPQVIKALAQMNKAESATGK